MAFDKRQDHANGALTVRPSTSSKVIRSSATNTAFTRGSILIAMLMPCLYNFQQIGANLITDGREFARGKTVIGARLDGLLHFGNNGGFPLFRICSILFLV